MHDYFDILGVSPDARVPEIRRAQRRRAAVSHPDVHDGEARLTGAATSAVAPQDVAIDFVDMATLVDRMRAAFFTDL